MIAIGVRFLAGRFHATPWGHQVNEGIPEWPPSPWRLLRALVATAKRCIPDLREEQLAALVSSLSEPPEISLPTATAATTRHWMPWFKKGPRDRTLVFDTFVAVDPGDEVQFLWPQVQLGARETELLKVILANMTYFGRAESWAGARLVDSPPTPNCRPLQVGLGRGEASHLVETLSVAPTEPISVLSALLTETRDLHGSNRLVPDGSRWVTYARPDSSLVTTPVSTPQSVEPPTIHLMRFAVSGKPLPLLIEALRFGELAKRALLSRFGKHHGGEVLPNLSGHRLNQAVQHQHAFYLPEDRDKDGRIDHLTIWIPGGLDTEKVKDLLSEHRLFRQPDERELDLLLLGYWSEAELKAGQGDTGYSAVWESVTPYVLTRHPKRHRTGELKLNERGEQRDGPADQIRREWALRQQGDPSLPNLVSVEFKERLYLRGSSLSISWLEFRRWRETGGGSTSGMAYGLRLSFDRPVRGPLAFGYARHFGLGQFQPVEC